MRRAVAIVALLVIVFAARAVVAHHSFVMFDMQRDVTYKGTVVEYHWRNPHTHIIIEVKPGAGVPQETVGTWDIEGGSTTIMGRQGWSRATFKFGDAVTVVGHPMRDGSKGASLFYVILADGKRLYHDIARPAGEPN